MLVHIVKPKYKAELDGWDYDDYEFLAAKTIETYDRFILFLKSYEGMKIEIDGEWYEVDDYVYSFPTDGDSIPCLRIYVTDYIA